jgi:hypothetical protein
LFEVIPFKTTQKEIIEFAQRGSLPSVLKDIFIHHSGEVHPGLYCPMGCTQILLELGPPQLPETTQNDALAIAQKYSQEHYQEFIKTHGDTSRIVACVHCANFGGAAVEGRSPIAHYKAPHLWPLRDSKIVSVQCSDPRIQTMSGSWWYDIGKEQPECEFFVPCRIFVYIYKSVTGWSEYAVR